MAKSKKSKRPVSSKDRLAQAGNLKPYQTYLTHEQVAALKTLTEHTRIPQTQYMREAVDDLLKKHKKGAK